MTYNFLEDLTLAERERVVSTPYKAGVYVSQADNSGGGASDEQEQRALEGIVEGFARDMFGSEMMQHVMRETYVNKDKWPQWAKELDTLADDLAECVEIFARVGDSKDVTVFRGHIMQLCEAIAMAFSEYDETNLLKKIIMQINYMRDTARDKKRGITPKTRHEYMSISLKERKALDEIAQHMGMIEYNS